jgi:hypothetical protein
MALFGASACGLVWANTAMQKLNAIAAAKAE